VAVCFFLFLIPIRYLAILLSVAIAVGVYFFVLGFRLLVRKRSMLTVPTSRIGSAARGLVEVGGVAAGPCNTLAPITGEACFLYHTTAWRQRDRKKNVWEKVADETLHHPFYIADSTGQLLVEAQGAHLELQPRFRAEYAATLLDVNAIPQSVSGFLSRHGIALDRNLRIEERLIKSEDALFITGTLAENPGVEVRPSSLSRDARAGARDRTRNTVRNDYRGNPAPGNSEPLPAPQIIRLASAAAAGSTREMSQQGKIAAALTRAALTIPQSRSSAGVPHQTVAVEEDAPPATLSSHSEIRLREVRLRDARPDEERPQTSGFNLIPPVVLMKGANDPTFVISFRSQKEIVSAVAWKAAAMVCGGTAVTLLGCYLLWTQIALL
jgi:hypothetical protein